MHDVFAMTTDSETNPHQAESYRRPEHAVSYARWQILRPARDIRPAYAERFRNGRLGAEGGNGFRLGHAAEFTHVNTPASTHVNARGRTIPLNMPTSFAGRLQEALAEKGCSRADLARAVGMTRATVTGWANGRIANPKGEGVSRAAHYLDVNPLWLASGRGAKRSDERSNALVGNPPHNVGVGPSSWTLERAREIEGVEFTKDVRLDLALELVPFVARQFHERFSYQNGALEYSSAISDETTEASPCANPNYVQGRKGSGTPQTRKRGQMTHICPNCGTMGRPKTVTRGSFLIECVLWLCMIIPGLIYSLWRLTSRSKVCPACRQPGMVPTGSPRGRELVAHFSPR